jgi:hypothetical protein
MGNKMFSRFGVWTIFIGLCAIGLFCGLQSSEEAPLRLAGTVKFPSRQAFSWQQTQADDKVAGEDKIKATIDTYFIIINESLKTSVLLDFGFLFDLNDINAWNDYAYERGLMHVRVEVDKSIDSPLISYTYKPEYFSINVNGASADVSMRGFADWIIKGHWGRVETSPWQKHEFRLALINGQWKIERARCLDVDQDDYPRGTDFNKAAEGAVKELLRLKKHDTSALRGRADISRELGLDQYGRPLSEPWEFNRYKCAEYALFH